jgi:hypothetical protein
MPRTLRKQRTREHVIASICANHVERFVVHLGHTVECFENDYGYDFTMFTYDDRGYAEPGYVFLQLKATDRPVKHGKLPFYRLRISIKDYHLWNAEPMPVVLILYDAGSQNAFWFYVQRHFEQNPSRRPKKGVMSVQIQIPVANLVGAETIHELRSWKKRVTAKSRRRVSHVETDIP